MKILVLEIPETALKMSARDVTRIDITLHRGGEVPYTYQLHPGMIVMREVSTTIDLE